ncbi:MAG: hypothetical protein NTY31_02775 [Candidatus Falkowbacteria bacterium]|nr:hypothetical protein [Candidatus Falkowbacteria bacterium]
MGLDILPKGGIGFRSKSGFGNFNKRLTKLTYREAGEFGMLKNNKKAIVEAIDERKEMIRKYGGLSRLQRKSALLEILHNDETITKQDKYKIKELLNNYARDKKTEAAAKAGIDLNASGEGNESSLQKAITAAEMRGAAKLTEIKKARPSVARINRDLDYLNVDTGKDHGTGLASGSILASNHYNVAANRGETSDKGLGAKDVHRPVGHQVGNI